MAGFSPWSPRPLGAVDLRVGGRADRAGGGHSWTAIGGGPDFRPRRQGGAAVVFGLAAASGSFLLAGAAAMCIFGALVQVSLIPWTMWVLLISGGLTWMAALVLVRSHSH